MCCRQHAQEDTHVTRKPPQMLLLMLRSVNIRREVVEECQVVGGWQWRPHARACLNVLLSTPPTSRRKQESSPHTNSQTDSSRGPLSLFACVAQHTLSGLRCAHAMWYWRFRQIDQRLNDWCVNRLCRSQQSVNTPGSTTLHSKDNILHMKPLHPDLFL